MINQENMDDWIHSFKEMEPAQANRLSEGLSDKVRSGLLGIALESAKLILSAEHGKVPQLLQSGIMAVIMEGFVQDPRDSIGVLALLNHAAEVRGLDLNEVLKDMRLDDQLLSSKYCKHWVERENKSLGQFGITVIRDESGTITDYDGISFNVP